MDGMPDALQATSACPDAAPGPGAPGSRGRARRRADRAIWSGWKPGSTRTRPRSTPSSKRRPGARHLTAAPVTRGTGIVWCPCTLTPLPCSIRQQCAGHFAPRLLPRHILTGLGPSAHTARGEVVHASRRKRRRQRRAAAEELRRTRGGGGSDAEAASDGSSGGSQSSHASSMSARSARAASAPGWADVGGGWMSSAGAGVQVQSVGRPDL